MQRCFELYLKSKKRNEVNYALILSQPPHLGPKDRLDETIDFLVDRFRDANYQKVLGQRNRSREENKKNHESHE